MAIKKLSSLDLQQNELQNAVIQNLTADPVSPKPGQIWYNSVAGQLKTYDGTAVRVILSGTLSVANGGTGSTTAAGARTALGVVGKYTASVGDGSTTSIAVTHGLNTTAVVVSVAYNAAPSQVVEVEVQITSANVVTLVFAVAPTTNQFAVTVLG